MNLMRHFAGYLRQLPGETLTWWQKMRVYSSAIKAAPHV